MNFQQLFNRVGVPILGITVVALAYRWYGWPGVVAAATGLVLWMLLHFNRVMAILKRAADRPMGYVDSAVMLNAKLRPGVTLLHVVAMTRALGEQRSAPEAQPEIYRWTDNSQSHVTCEFVGGKLRQWALERPQDGQGAA
ncbi:MAG: glycerate kinase [Rhodoferax sp.]|jgi:hypothetical protein|nr:glycerate kinase [Rhodoferax sp.]